MEHTYWTDQKPPSVSNSIYTKIKKNICTKNYSTLLLFHFYLNNLFCLICLVCISGWKFKVCFIILSFLFVFIHVHLWFVLYRYHMHLHKSRRHAMYAHIHTCSIKILMNITSFIFQKLKGGIRLPSKNQSSQNVRLNGSHKEQLTSTVWSHSTYMYYYLIHILYTETKILIII